MTKEEFFKLDKRVALVVDDLVGNYDTYQIALLADAGNGGVVRSIAVRGFATRHKAYDGADYGTVCAAVTAAAQFSLDLKFQFGSIAGHTMPSWTKQYFAKNGTVKEHVG